MLGLTLDEFSAAAMSAPAGSGGVMFLPDLEGERTPPLPNARGQLVGLTLSNMTPANIARATIEGVLWSLAYRLQTLRAQTGEISGITLTGGAAQSAAVRAVAPAVFGLPIASTEPFESVAVGAAKQAAWAFAGSMSEWPVPYVNERTAPSRMWRRQRRSAPATNPCLNPLPERRLSNRESAAASSPAAQWSCARRVLSQVRHGVSRSSRPPPGVGRSATPPAPSPGAADERRSTAAIAIVR
jgi:glycerol kinase